MNPQINLTEKAVLPVYLFTRLGKYIGISTSTGDFYDLTPQTYAALMKWNEKINLKGPAVTADDISEYAREYSLPEDIYRLFPLPRKQRAFEDRNALSAISDITLNLTSQCSLRCVYCWNDQGKYSNTEFQPDSDTLKKQEEVSSDMSIETACRSVDMLVKLCKEDKQLVVDFYGGEPLENVETLEATVDYCRENEKKWGVRFHFLLATNGTLLTPSLAKNLIDKGVQIAVSVDGPKAVHDNNRPYADGRGSFEKIAENLKGMDENVKKRLVGRTTVTPFFSDMVALYKNLRDLGFERIELFESEDACHKITPQREAMFFNTDSQYETLFKEYERLAYLYVDEIVSGQLDYRKTFFNRFFKLMQRLYYNHEVSGGCPAAKGQIAVSGDGNIYPCTSFLGIEQFCLGNVHTGLDEQKYRRFIEMINNRFDMCSTCEIFSVCRTTGSCLNMNYYFNGDPARSHERSCDLFAEKLKLAIATLAILSDKIPDKLDELFGHDPVGRRGNELY
ncbi:MAG: radical SAM protein [Candidatus Omnitrophica bacterium]|nr:radical SAM protein [Candidatus Omnitrophota bacterium]